MSRQSIDDILNSSQSHSQNSSYFSSAQKNEVNSNEYEQNQHKLGTYQMRNQSEIKSFDNKENRELSQRQQAGIQQDNSKIIYSFHESWNDFKSKANHNSVDQEDENHNQMSMHMMNKSNIANHPSSSNKKQLSEVQTSCPAKVFKNYSNVFAEITKNVIGEIQDSESDMDDDSKSIQSDSKSQDQSSIIQQKIIEDARKAFNDITINKMNQSQLNQNQIQNTQINSSNINNNNNNNKNNNNNSNQVYQYSSNESSMMIEQNKQVINKAFDDFFQKLTTDLGSDQVPYQDSDSDVTSTSMIFTQQQLNQMNQEQILIHANSVHDRSKNLIATIEEDFDGENMQSEISTNRLGFPIQSYRKDQQNYDNFMDNNTNHHTFRQKNVRQSKESSERLNNDHSSSRISQISNTNNTAQKTPPPLNLFRQPNKSPSVSPHRYQNYIPQNRHNNNDDSQESSNNSTPGKHLDFKNVNVDLKVQANLNQRFQMQNKIQNLHLLDNDNNELNFEVFYSGKILGNSLKLFNSSQNNYLSLQVFVDQQTEGFTRSDLQNIYGISIEEEEVFNSYQSFYLEDPNSRQLVQATQFTIPPNQELKLIVVLQNQMFLQEMPFMNIVSQLVITCPDQQQIQKVIARGKLYQPQVRCFLPLQQEEGYISLDINQAVQKFELKFKNTNEIGFQLPPLKLQFTLVNLNYYRHILSQQQTEQPIQIDYAIKKIQMENGTEMKLKKTELNLKDEGLLKEGEDPSKIERTLKIKVTQKYQTQNKIDMAILVGKIIDTDLIYYFILESRVNI
ncbi:UNKNOWN [Stylonychia lemnae]|uniref:Uncharacterized protein n=1 Tax=Stylonychia lemnae TaxID=5949 RepID=A0A078B9P9_STYLE|nr:UNKNOWN [Stylonychia lemnae]|eukprot:CDW90911.1 UNKNOWN [Stylonychia lemnae]